MSTIIKTESYVIEVTQQTFVKDVLEQSKTVPVVVDFWAEWCGPCRQLGPILEKLAIEFKGGFILAKVDVDRNQGLAQQFHVQGIPAVKAFYQGKVVDEFTGALPEPQVRQFLQKLVPSQADLLARQGYDWEMSNQLAMAVTNYRKALTEQEDHYSAMVGLGRTLLKQGETEEALTILESIPDGPPEKAVANALIATAEFQQYAAGYTESDLRAKIETDPADLDSRYALGALLATEQKFEVALAEFLEIVRHNRQYNEGAARKAMIALFTSIGADHPIVKTYQSKLASALF